MKPKFLALCGTALPLIANPANSGPLDRDILGLGVFYERGSVHQVHYSWTSSSIEGDFGSASTNDAGAQYTTYGYGFKADMSEKFSHAIMVDRPYGSDIDFTDADAETGLRRSKAEFSSYRASYLMRYKMNENLSLVGGIIGEEIKPAFVWFTGAHSTYTLRTNAVQNFGYALGGIYENPEQALRLSALYTSSVEHEMKATERGISGNKFTFSTPQTLTLSAQKGIGKNTSISGSIRWSEWSEFDYSPPNYEAEFGEMLLTPEEDIITYSLSVGHRLNEKFSLFGGIRYEPATDGKVNILMPYDGSTNLNIGGQYSIPMSNGTTKIAGGLTYTMLGDASGDLFGSPYEFNDSSELGFGLSISYSY